MADRDIGKEIVASLAYQSAFYATHDRTIPARPDDDDCDTCNGSGVIVAMDTPEGIQRCDQCDLFPGDLEAALVAAARLTPPGVVKFDGDDGQRYTFAGQDLPAGLCIKSGTNPWVEVDGQPVDWMKEEAARE